MLSSELQSIDSPPFYRLTNTPARTATSGFTTDTNFPLPEGLEGERWAVGWRVMVRMREGNPVPLPLPKGKHYYAGLREMLRVPARQLAALHK